jgi:hypothetical protein
MLGAFPFPSCGPCCKQKEGWNQQNLAVIGNTRLGTVSNCHECRHGYTLLVACPRGCHNAKMSIDGVIMTDLLLLLLLLRARLEVTITDESD